MKFSTIYRKAARRVAERKAWCCGSQNICTAVETVTGVFQCAAWVWCRELFNDPVYGGIEGDEARCLALLLAAEVAAGEGM